MSDYVPDNRFHYTAIDVRAALEFAIDEAGGAAYWAAQNDINPAWLDLFRAESTQPTRNLLTALGFEQRTFYRRIGE